MRPGLRGRPGHGNKSLNSLVSKSQTGDGADFRSQLVELMPRLRRFAHGLTGSAADADDLVQSTLERALQKLDQWQPGTRLDSWLYRIAQNLWIDQVRSVRTRGTAVDVEALEAVAGSDGRVTNEQQLTMRDTRRAMAELPAEQRAVLMLVAVEEMSYADAAQALDIPIGTVMSRLSRARRALAERLSYGSES
jgi:RNA polymerase sigma-70 factor, ECF subfamily